MRATLPPGWEVHETLEGRYLFQEKSSGHTSWVHPDAEFARHHYEWWPGAHPSYEAISYVWGSLDTLATVYVEHEDGEETPHAELQVPPNLAIALRHLRYTDHSRTLWADSISINQLDLLERNSHVKRMSDIYKFAYRVVMWLGPASYNSKLAIRSLRRFAAEVDYTSGLLRVRSPGARYPKWHVSADELPFTEETWQAILDLITRPWFDRLWIYQEAQLANSLSFILCGADNIDWPHFRRAMMCLRDLPNVPLPPFVSRTMILERLVAPIKNLGFLILLSRAHQCLCSDQRDKIYGILSLAPPQLLRHIEPDYRKSVGMVYRDMFVALVKQTQRLEILTYSIQEPQRRSDMPSWSPDWSYFPRFPLGHCIVYDMAPVTGGYTRVEADFSKVSEGILEVSGVLSGTVHHINGAPPHDIAEALAAIRQWAPDFAKYPTGEDAEDAYAWTLVQGRVNERYAYFPVSPGYVISLQEQKEAIYREVRDEGRLPDDGERLQEVLYKIHDRAFFTTNDGYFGLAPAATQQGDRIVTILGCDELIVLRPLPSNFYQVVGPCYLHGYWDGESLLGRMPASWSLKFVKDRSGIDVPRFVNAETGELTHKDPRLASLPLPEGWVQLADVERTMNDPFTVQFWRNEKTGEKMNSDPRMTEEKLRERGVKIERFSLV